MIPRAKLVVGNEAADATIVIPKRAFQLATEMASRPAADGDDRTIVRFPPTVIPPLPPEASLEEWPGLGQELRTKTSAAHAAPGVSLRTPISWPALVSAQVVILTASSALLVAISMAFWHVHSLRVIEVARATTLVNWLAVAARDAEGRDDLSATADTVAREPGVVTALVLRSDGRVLFPASRTTEVLDLIPELNVRLSDLSETRIQAGKDVLHIARPVFGARGLPIAVAFISLQRSALQDFASVILVIGPVFIVVLAAAVIVTRSIRQSTLQRLALLNEDFELAVSGQLDSVEDPLGLPPLKALTNTINYLITRLHDQERSFRALADPLDDDSSSLLSSARAHRISHPSTAHIVADSRFLVTSANQECFDVLGLHPDKMIGRHIVDAFQSKAAIVEAVLGCLVTLPAIGEAHASVKGEGSAIPLEVVLTRSKDQPLTITVARQKGECLSET